MAMTTTNATPPKTKATNTKTAAALPPKALAWTHHFESRDFGVRFELLAQFAKDAGIQSELLEVVDHEKAMAILSRLSCCCEMMYLRSLEWPVFRCCLLTPQVE